MDCVGCDKCRLWGKVQVTGLAAALKILFELDEKALEYVFHFIHQSLSSLTSDPCSPYLNRNLLSRSEVVALLQTLFRFSESLHATDEFRKMWAETQDTEAILKESEVEKEKEAALKAQEITWVVSS